MVFVPDVPYTDPGSWRIAMEASAATLSVSTMKGPRVLHELPSFDGAFRLTPAGLLAGFSLRLPLPDRDACLLWEATDLAVPARMNALARTNAPGGRAKVRLGRRETVADLSALCARVPDARFGRAYLKIVLETVFPSLSLRWPAKARLRPVALKLFSEIRPVG
ncbi:hypothetical protein [Nonomuraea rhizosphaerae]|uniref:hypothetical protein n=1 Tax=Nonomuraea rhizosphaerae TaxID=2665663 RepID=UPI001C5D4D51|nr:hypothetical protein [Nonomuraea rhizosphaerae]